MTTCRDVISSAYGVLGVTAPGDAPTADELDAGLSALAALVLEIHEARGPLIDIDVSADCVAGEDQRIRVQAGAQVSVTLPNSVWVSWASSPGSTAPADGLVLRAPRDGSRVAIVGTTQQLFFYRADLNAWQAAGPLSLDGPTPLNARYEPALAAVIAGRLAGPMGLLPDPALAFRAARANAALLIRPAVARGPVRLPSI